MQKKNNLFKKTNYTSDTETPIFFCENFLLI